MVRSIQLALVVVCTYKTVEYFFFAQVCWAGSCTTYEYRIHVQHREVQKVFELQLYMSHCQMFGKVEYGLPAKIGRLVGCTEMLS